MSQRAGGRTEAARRVLPNRCHAATSRKGRQPPANRGLRPALIGTLVPALVLVLIVGIWAVIAGVVQIAAAFAAGEPAGTRALFILAGLISVAFGVVLCARPHVGAITLALLFGLFNLIFGIWMVVQGIELRRTGKTLDSAVPEKQPA